jgi:molybdopterin adenylyltransferase
MIGVGILTVSDRGARGERAEDGSADAIRELLPRFGGQEVDYRVVPDEQALIEAALVEWADRDIALVLTTGGTGLAPRDVTPEATRRVIERELPGLPEAMRAAGMRKTPFAMISRMVAGMRGRTLIINLPGSPKAVRENLEAVLEVLPHALATLRDASFDHRD